MRLTIKYFGMIAEAAGKAEEVVEVQTPIGLQELKAAQLQKYNIRDADSVQLAVNQDLKRKAILKEGDEVAFLPPFAGG